MMKTILRINQRWMTFFVGIPLVMIAAACNIAKPAHTLTSEALVLMAATDSVTVWATGADLQTAEDILRTLQVNSAQLCASLQTPCQFSVTIEVYPDQESFNEHVMNPEMRGFFALSGANHRIQMVSPAHPSPHKISYEDGISVAVHEFAHLALDEINPELPIWLDEGVAVYAGPHEPYTTVCKYAFPFELLPSFRELENNYNHVPAADLFAYTVIDFIASEYGMEKLNLLLRTPENLESVLGIPGRTFEEDWHRFIHLAYHNYKTQAISVLGFACITFLALGAILTLRMVRRRRKGTQLC